MTLYRDNVASALTDHTPVHLANHSLVSATHRGLVALPLNTVTHVPALVVPNLHKPLLSVAGVCNQDLTLVFNSSSCKIFMANDVLPQGEPLG
jgi:hypothetical protein